MITLLDLLTGNLWDEVMFDTVGATGSQSGIIFYVLWLILSRWLVVAMVVTVFFYRIDVDTEDYLKIAARNSMRSVFALEHAFMQCHKSHVFVTWRRRYEETTGNRTSNKGQIKLLEYSRPAAQPGPWKRMVSSKNSLLTFAPQNPVREFCVWLTQPPIFDKRSTNGSSTSNRHQGPMAATNSGFSIDREVGQRSCWERFIVHRSRLHWFARCVVETLFILAGIVTLVDVSMDAELHTTRRGESDYVSVMYALEVFAVVVFSLEAIVLFVAKGVVFLPGAYLRDPLNILDFSVTVLSGVCLVVFQSASWNSSALVSALKAARALRAARLLRLVGNAHGLVRVLESIRSSGRALCLAGMITVFFWMQWSIVGLQVWCKWHRVFRVLCYTGAL